MTRGYKNFAGSSDSRRGTVTVTVPLLIQPIDFQRGLL